ncbi:MAG: Gfo/Idh/MocA family oxidoreductase [Thermoleophilaceae bacterium]
MNARVGLIGYGLAGEVFHAPLIASEPGLSLSFIVTGNPERRARAERSYPDTAVLGSPDELWARAGELDLIVVAAPNRAHLPLAGAAIEAGVPVVVDKPLAGTAAEAAELVERAERSGVILTVFQNRRLDGDYLTARKLIEQGKLGSVHRFESRFERWQPEVDEGWRELGASEEGGGVLLDLGSHLVDQALQLFGPARSVYGELDSRRAGAKVDDDSFVAITHENGVRSHLWMSATAAQFGPRLRVLGDRAAFVKYGLDPQEDALAGGARPGDNGWGLDPEELWGALGTVEGTRRVATEAGAYERFYAGVGAALRGEAPPPVDPRDAVAALEVLDAARG